MNDCLRLGEPAKNVQLVVNRRTQRCHKSRPVTISVEEGQLQRGIRGDNRAIDFQYYASFPYDIC